MKCLICGCDITDEINQFGDTKNPMCQSDFLSGFEWVYDDNEIIEYLKQGMSIDEAVRVSNEKSNDNLKNEFLEIMHEISISISEAK